MTYDSLVGWYMLVETSFISGDFSVFKTMWNPPFPTLVLLKGCSKFPLLLRWANLVSKGMLLSRPRCCHSSGYLGSNTSWAQSGAHRSESLEKWQQQNTNVHNLLAFVPQAATERTKKKKNLSQFTTSLPKFPFELRLYIAQVWTAKYTDSFLHYVSH